MAMEKEKRSFGSILANFWYYHKWHTFAVIFVVFTLAVCLSQCISSESADYTVGVYLNRAVTSNETDLMEKVLEKYGKDVNGDGKVVVEIYNFSYKQSDTYTQEGESQKTRLNTELAAGEIMLLITDDYRMKEFERLEIVSDELFTLSENGSLYAQLEGVLSREEMSFFIRKTEGYNVMKVGDAEERLAANRELYAALEKANSEK